MTKTSVTVAFAVLWIHSAAFAQQADPGEPPATPDAAAPAKPKAPPPKPPAPQAAPRTVAPPPQTPPPPAPPGGQAVPYPRVIQGEPSAPGGQPQPGYAYPPTAPPAGYAAPHYYQGPAYPPGYPPPPSYPPTYPPSPAYPYGPPPGYARPTPYYYYPPPRPPGIYRPFSISLGLGYGGLSVPSVPRQSDGGLAYTARVSFGVTRNWLIVLGLDGVDVSRPTYGWSLTSYTLGAQYFLLPRLYLRAGFGIASFDYADSNYSYDTGQAFLAGAGLELTQGSMAALALEWTTTAARLSGDNFYNNGLSLVLSFY